MAPTHRKLKGLRPLASKITTRARPKAQAQSQNSSKSEAKPKFKPRTRQQFNRDAAAYAMRRKAMGWRSYRAGYHGATAKRTTPQVYAASRLKSVPDTPERLICDLMCDHVRMRGGPRGREQKIMDKRKSACR